MGKYDHYDESSVRVRPSRRGTRPRTKDRPSHDDAKIGMVIGVDRGRYTVVVGDGKARDEIPSLHSGATVVTAMRARALTKTSIVVGDRVALVGDTSGEPDALARIVRIEDRASVLRRSADDSDTIERIIVANADQLVIVTALADPEPRLRMIDRCLVAAYDAGMQPLLVLTKSDLADPSDLLSGYAALDIPYLLTCLRPRQDAEPDDVDDSGIGTHSDGLDEVRTHLVGQISVLVGHSGVGKSTLVNALVPDAARTTGAVNATTGRGRHTSTSAVAIPLPEGGWVVDTPGVRSFGLGHVDPADFVQHFPELVAGTAGCPRGCSHDEPDCALDTWVASGDAGEGGPARLESLRRLLRSRTADSF